MPPKAPPRAKASSGRPDGDAASLADGATAVRFQQSNPKRRGSEAFSRYEGYKKARTVGEALSLGALRGDLKNDLSKGFLGFDGSGGSDAAAAGSAAAAPLPCQARAAPVPDAASAAASAAAAPPPCQAAPAPRGKRAGAALEAGASDRSEYTSQEAPLSAILQGTLHERLLKQRGAAVGSEARPAAGHLAAGRPANRRGAGLMEGKQPSPSRSGATPLIPRPVGMPPMPEDVTGASGSGSSASSASMGCGLAGSLAGAGRPSWQVQELPPLPPRPSDPWHAAPPSPVDSPPAAAASPGTPPPAAAAWPSLASRGAAALGGAPPPAARGAPSPGGASPTASEPSIPAPPAAATPPGGAHPDAVAAAAGGASPATASPAQGAAEEAERARLAAELDAAPTFPSQEDAGGPSAAGSPPHAPPSGEGRDPWEEDAGGSSAAGPPPPAPPSGQGRDPWEEEEAPMIAEADGDGGDDDEEEITLRLRLGVTVVKREVEGDDEPAGASCGVAELSPPVGEGSEQEQPPAAAERAGAEAPAAGPLQELFQQQRQQRQQEGADEEEPEGGATQQQMDEAQTASYEINVSERRAREARDLQLVEQGSLEPLEALDEELMMLIVTTEGMLDWLGRPANRLLLFRYLGLRSQAVKWYRDHAEAYFSERRRQLEELLGQPDAAIVVADMLTEETEKVQAAMFAMPEKGHFAPLLFARCPSGSGAAGSSTGSGGAVEVD